MANALNIVNSGLAILAHIALLRPGNICQISIVSIPYIHPKLALSGWIPLVFNHSTDAKLNQVLCSLIKHNLPRHFRIIRLQHYFAGINHSLVCLRNANTKLNSKESGSVLIRTNCNGATIINCRGGYSTTHKHHGCSIEHSLPNPFCGSYNKALCLAFKICYAI